MRTCLTKFSRTVECGAVQKCAKGAKVYYIKSCRSRQELSNEYLLANFSVDTSEKGPLNVCQKLLKLA